MTEVPAGAGDQGGQFVTCTAGRDWLITAGYAAVVAVGLLLLGGGRLVDADTFGGVCAGVEAAVLGFQGLRRSRSASRPPSAGDPSASVRPPVLVVAVLTGSAAVCAAIGLL